MSIALRIILLISAVIVAAFMLRNVKRSKMRIRFRAELRLLVLHLRSAHERLFHEPCELGPRNESQRAHPANRP